MNRRQKQMVVEAWAMNKARIDSGQLYRANYLATQPERVENELWRKVDPKDVHRIKCDRSEMCGENAMWASRTVLPCTYVCDYHRAVFDVTGTLWKDDGNAA